MHLRFGGNLIAAGANRCLKNSDSPAPQGHSRPTPRSEHRPHRWIRAKTARRQPDLHSATQPRHRQPCRASASRPATTRRHPDHRPRRHPRRSLPTTTTPRDRYPRRPRTRTTRDSSPCPNHDPEDGLTTIGASTWRDVTDLSVRLQCRASSQGDFDATRHRHQTPGRGPRRATARTRWARSGQISWPPAGSSTGHQWAIPWPPTGSFSWPPTGEAFWRVQGERSDI